MSYDNYTEKVRQLRNFEKMREFKNGNVDEFFTKDEFDELKKEHCFKDPEAVRERIAHLYAFNRPEANCEPLMTAKEVNKRLRSIKSRAARIVEDLDLPFYKSVFLHSRMGIDRGPLVEILTKLSVEAGYLQEMIQPDKRGHPFQWENLWIKELLHLYQSDTGTSPRDYSYNPANEEGSQYRGKGLSFIRACVKKADLWKTDDAIVHLIKDSKNRACDN
jgi:hypothetical protein